MAGQIVLRRPVVPLRRDTVRTKKTPARARFAEVAGGTTAECAAVWCCCPCGIVNLVVFTVVRLPAGLCRKALKKNRKKKKTPLLPQPKRDDEDSVMQMHDFEWASVSSDMWPDKSPSVVVSEMEKEMWTKFYGTGFWRNPSGREQ